MEKEKRKRSVDDGGKDSKRGKASEDDDGMRTTTETRNDEEVEEFYAILRRIKVAVKYFEKGSGGRKLTAAKGSSLLSPTFEWESFEKSAAADGGVIKSSREGVEDINVGLDLNADPDPETDPEFG